MHKNDKLAILFGFLTFGAGKETLLVYTAEDGEPVVVVMGVIATLVFASLTFCFFLFKKR